MRNFDAALLLRGTAALSVTFFLSASAAAQTPNPAPASPRPSTVAPGLAELAVQAVRENNVAELSFSDKEFVLSYQDASDANRDAADKVWKSIQELQKNGAARLKIPVKVISADGTTILAAITGDNQLANKVDVVVVMKESMAKPPAAGSLINVIGVLSNYRPMPFQFTMLQGEVAASDH